jgi:HEAT repeat protein
MQQPRTQAAPAAAPKPSRQPVPPPELQEGAIARMDAAGLIAIAKNEGAPEFQRAKACQRLGELGPREAVPALAALLSNDHLSVYARYGLEPIADPSVDDALRAALTKLKGVQLIGVINSIGKRRDAKAAPALVRMLHGSDADVARAAASAIGKIGGDASAKELKGALGKSTGLVKMAVADGMLVCAERYLAEGKRNQALALYASLTAADVPQAARLGAMAGIIREENSMTRPR